MSTKLIKATVRASGNVVYVGRVYRPRNDVSSWDSVTEFSSINSRGCPATIPTKQRYMKVSSLSR